MLNRDGAATHEWKGGGTLSPDGRVLTEMDEKDRLIVRDAKTGKVVRELDLHLLSEPNDPIGHGWLDADEYIIEAETPEPGGSFGYYAVNVRTGRSSRIRDLPLDPGETVSLGKVRIDR